MSGAGLLAGAVGLLVLGAATTMLWLDRRGQQSALRTASGAAVAWLVTAVLERRVGQDVMNSTWEPQALSAVDAAMWLGGVATALVVAWFLGWASAPLEGVALGAVVGASAAVALGVAASEPAALVLAPLRVGWQTAVGACVGGGVSLAGLQRSRTRRVGLGTGAFLAGWLLCAALLLGQRVTADRLAENTLLIAAAGVLAAAAIAALARLGNHIEARILSRELDEEARFGVIPAAVAVAVARLGSRLRADWWPHAEERRWLSATLTELALRKHRVRGAGGGVAALDGLHIGRIRTRVRKSLIGGGAGDDRDG